MTFSSVTIAGFPFSNAGATKLFLQGGTGPVVKPAAPVYFMELVNFTLPTKGRDEKITFPVPSQLKAGEVVNRTAQAGAYASQTMTLSMYLSADLREGWFDALEESGVVNMWMPISDGTRFLDDPDDFDSGFAVYLATVNSTTPENEANTYSNTDAPLPFNLGVELGYESFSTLVIRKTQPASSSVTLAEDINAVGFRSVSGGVNWIAAMDGGSTTKGMLVATNANGDWGTLQDISDLANDNDVDDMVVLGNRTVIISSDLGANGGHIVIDVDDIVGASAAISGTAITSGYVSSGGPSAVYAQSPSNLIVVGDGGHIYCLSSVLGTPTECTGSASVTTESLNDVHGFGNQVMAVGGDASTSTIIVSNDSGETWASATGTNVEAQAVNCVFMTAKDTAWVGTSGGKLYYTEDFGKNFTEVIHATGMTVLSDIEFLTLDDGTVSGLGYLVGTGSNNRTLARTRDNGRSWHTGGSDIGTLPANTNLKAVSIRKANQVIAGGAATASAGIALVS